MLPTNQRSSPPCEPEVQPTPVPPARRKACKELSTRFPPVSRSSKAGVTISCPAPVTLNGLAAADAYIIPTIPDFLSTYGIPQIQNRVRRFGEEIGRTIVELGVVITKYKSNSSVHSSTTKRLRRDPTIQHVLPNYINESNAIAAAAEFAPYGTLKVKYGNQGQFDQFRGLAVDVMTEAREKIK